MLSVCMYVCMYVCMGFIAFITAMVLSASSQDLLLSVSVRRVRVVFSTSGFKGGEKQYPKTRETKLALKMLAKSVTYFWMGASAGYALVTAVIIHSCLRILESHKYG